MTILARGQAADVTEIVERTRALRWWIDRQIEKGLRDDEIACGVPLAASVIAGRVSIEELRSRMADMAERA